jgi:hypothetical protein
MASQSNKDPIGCTIYVFLAAEDLVGWLARPPSKYPTANLGL